MLHATTIARTHRANEASFGCWSPLTSVGQDTCQAVSLCKFDHRGLCTCPDSGAMSIEHASRSSPGKINTAVILIAYYQMAGKETTAWFFNNLCLERHSS